MTTSRLESYYPGISRILRRPNEVKPRDLTANATDRFSSHRNGRWGLVVSSNVSEFRAILDDPLFPTEFEMELYVQGVLVPLRAYNPNLR